VVRRRGTDLNRRHENRKEEDDCEKQEVDGDEDDTTLPLQSISTHLIRKGRELINYCNSFKIINLN
jgi:hypothetical protein